MKTFPDNGIFVISIIIVSMAIIVIICKSFLLNPLNNNNLNIISATVDFLSHSNNLLIVMAIMYAIMGYVFISKRINTKKFFYSFAIKFAYSVALCLISGCILYTISFLYAADFKLGIIAIISYLILEIRMLFFENAFYEPPSFKSKRSFPTPGILVAAPIAYVLISVLERRINWLDAPIWFNIWALIRYYVLNPYWLIFETNDKSFYGGLKKPNEYTHSTIWPYVTRWTGSPLIAETV